MVNVKKIVNQAVMLGDLSVYSVIFPSAIFRNGSDHGGISNAWQVDLPQDPFRMQESRYLVP